MEDINPGDVIPIAILVSSLLGGFLLFKLGLFAIKAKRRIMNQHGTLGPIGSGLNFSKARTAQAVDSIPYVSYLSCWEFGYRPLGNCC